MSKQIVVLLGLNAEHEIVESETGLAFTIGKLLYHQWVAIYVAKSKSDAQAAIDHYGDNGTLNDFISQESWVLEAYRTNTKQAPPARPEGSDE